MSETDNFLEVFEKSVKRVETAALKAIERLQYEHLRDITQARKDAAARQRLSTVQWCEHCDRYEPAGEHVEGER